MVACAAENRIVSKPSSWAAVASSVPPLVLTISMPEIVSPAIAPPLLSWSLVPRPPAMVPAMIPAPHGQHIIAIAGVDCDNAGEIDQEAVAPRDHNYRCGNYNPDLWQLSMPFTQATLKYLRPSLISSC